MRKVLNYWNARMLRLAGGAALCAAIIIGVGVSYARSAKSSVEIAEGRFDRSNYFDLLRFIGKRQDKVIGLKISIDKAEKSDRYLTEIEGQQLIIASLGKDPGIEVLVSDGRFEHGGYVLDGFYLVKSGGVHQGTSSYGLTSVDEAQIRLNSNLATKSVKVGK